MALGKKRAEILHKKFNQASVSDLRCLEVNQLQWLPYSAQKVLCLVDGIALNCRPTELLNEFFLYVLDVNLLSANLHGLLLSGLEVFFLSAIGKEAYHDMSLIMTWANLE